jgi:hypothetical protein
VRPTSPKPKHARCPAPRIDREIVRTEPTRRSVRTPVKPAVVCTQAEEADSPRNMRTASSSTASRISAGIARGGVG